MIRRLLSRLWIADGDPHPNPDTLDNWGGVVPQLEPDVELHMPRAAAEYLAAMTPEQRVVWEAECSVMHESLRIARGQVQP